METVYASILTCWFGSSFSTLERSSWHYMHYSSPCMNLWALVEGSSGKSPQTNSVLLRLFTFYIFFLHLFNSKVIEIRPPSWKSRNHLFCIINTLITGDLMKQEARPSALVMVMAWKHMCQAVSRRPLITYWQSHSLYLSDDVTPDHSVHCSTKHLLGRHITFPTAWKR